MVEKTYLFINFLLFDFCVWGHEVTTCHLLNTLTVTIRMEQEQRSRHTQKT